MLHNHHKYITRYFIRLTYLHNVETMARLSQGFTKAYLFIAHKAMLTRCLWAACKLHRPCETFLVACSHEERTCYALNETLAKNETPKHKQFVESNEVNVEIAKPQVHCNFVNLCSSWNFTNLAWICSQFFALYHITPVLTCRIIWECHQVDRTSTKYLLSIVTQSAQDKVI